MLTHGGGGETVYETGRTRRPEDTLHLPILSSPPPNSWFTLFLLLPSFGSSFTYSLIEPQKSKDFPVSKTITNERHKQSNFQESLKVLQQYQHFPEKEFLAIIGQHRESWFLENCQRKYAVINGVNKMSMKTFCAVNKVTSKQKQKTKNTSDLSNKGFPFMTLTERSGELCIGSGNVEL